jgi:DNA-binding IclR family transcriptional regulator
MQIERTIARKQGSSLTALKALKVLEIIATSPVELTLLETAALLKSDKITTYRMLLTLQEAGLVIKNKSTKRYRLSYKLVSLCRNLLAENEVTDLILRTLRDLSRETQETLHYSVLDGYEAVLIHRVKGSQLVCVDFQIGDRAPLHCTSIGKVLLAYQEPRFLNAFIASGLTPMASATIVDPVKLRTELAGVKRSGYAIDDHEFADNMRCIAVPVIENGGLVRSGISISGPDSRFTLEKLLELKEPLLAASAALSRQLGGLPWHEE